MREKNHDHDYHRQGHTEKETVTGRLIEYRTHTALSYWFYESFPSARFHVMILADEKPRVVFQSVMKRGGYGVRYHRDDVPFDGRPRSF